MRTLIACGLSALALSACQRPAEPVADAAAGDAVDAVAVTEDTPGGAMQAGSTDGTTGADSAPASGSGASSGGGASDGRTSAERLSSAGGRSSSGALTSAPGVTGSTGSTGSSDVSQAARDAAKAEAEATNLRPQTP